MLWPALLAFSQNNTYTDTIYHFSFSYPDGWQELASNKGNLRIMLSSPEGDYALAAHAYFLEEGFFDIEKLAEGDEELFRDLGPAVSEEVNTVIPYVGKYLEYLAEGAGEILNIQKKYGPFETNGYAWAYFTVDEHYAYILIMYSVYQDMPVASQVFESFQKEAGWLTKWRNNWSWAYQKRSAIGVVLLAVFFLYLSGLTFSGRGVRKWQSRIRALRRHSKNAGPAEQTDPKWQHAYRRSMRQLLIYLLLFAVLTLPAIILYYDLWAAYVTTLGFFIAGYYGYKVVIEDPS